MASSSSACQPKIKDAFQMLTKLPTSCRGARELTESVAYFIGKDKQPISLVQGEGFKRMISCFEPRFQLPHRTKFMGCELHNLLQKTKEQVTAALV